MTMPASESAGAQMARTWDPSTETGAVPRPAGVRVALVIAPVTV